MTFGDHPLAWCHPYGQGRVFYTALGHFESTWRDARFQEMLRQALLWVTRQRDGDGAPRPPVEPVVTALGNAASLQPRDTIAPGSLISIYGRNLTSGSTLSAAGASRLAGAAVKLNGAPVPLLYASPGQINAFVPHHLKPATAPEPGYHFELSTPGGSIARGLSGTEATPGVFTVTVHPGYVTIWATGLGPVERLAPRVALAGNPARVLFAGLSPVHPGLYQVNAEVPAGLSGPVRLDFESSGVTHSVAIHLLSAP